jgi:Predicted metal-dependent enzyme
MGTPGAPDDNQNNPRVLTVARRARAVAPETPLSVVAEMLRMSPYRAVPVAETGTGDGTGNPRLAGMVTEEALVAALLGAADAAERQRVLALPARALLREPDAWVTPGMRVSEVAPLFYSEERRDVLPVLDGSDRRIYLGLLGPSDLVRDLAQPFRPPLVGGMATPLGVYLTTGEVSGGVGTLALAATGLVTLALQLCSAALFLGLQYAVLRFVPATTSAALLSWLPVGTRSSALETLAMFVQTLLFLSLLRLSPLAGYHAAEHQVVHALERREPLVPEAVRLMPRVHPRCSTNLVAGALLVWLTGTALYPLLGGAAYLLGTAVALRFWRSAGAVLQQHFTTRPPSDTQIESGIRAARALLEAHDRAPFAAPRPVQRLWRMGFAQILLGAGTGLLALYGLAAAFPGLEKWLAVLIGV